MRRSPRKAAKEEIEEKAEIEEKTEVVEKSESSEDDVWLIDYDS